MEHFTTDLDQATKQAAGNYIFGNPDLPFAGHRPEFDAFLNNMIEDNTPVGAVVGETGSGKTTTGPQAALETGLFKKIYMSEPTIFLARETRNRLVAEMSESLGRDASDVVGYGTSSEGVLHPKNEIIIGTHGYISQSFIHATDREREGVLAIADEYHERGIEGDAAVEINKKLGIMTLLMSATPDIERMVNFHCSYDGQTPAPLIQIEGRTFPIERITREDSTEAAIWAVKNNLDTLYILPGKDDIDREMGRITRRLHGHTFIGLPLHGELSPDAQSRVMKKYDKTRLILATNYADTGSTLGVDVVINTGVNKTIVMRGGVETLTVERTSKARDTQRIGRVGRDKPGIAITAPYDGVPAEVYTREQQDFDTVEMQSRRLDTITLRLGQMGLGLQSMEWPDEPDAAEVKRAELRLQNIGAFDDTLSLTEMGNEMAHLPLNPSLARMVAAAKEQGGDIHRFMAIGAVLSQLGGVGQRIRGQDQWRKLSRDKNSEMLRNLDVYIRALHLNDEQRSAYGILDIRMKKAERQISSLCHREDLPMDGAFDRVPTPEERLKLRECMVTGIEEIYTSQKGKKFRDYTRRQLRRLPKDIALNSSRLVAGQPWNKDAISPRSIRPGYFIKDAFNVDIEMLLRVAPERCSYKNFDYELDEKGEIIVHRHVYFSGVPTGHNIRSSLQESTPEVREFIINGLFQESLINEQALPEAMAQFRHEILELRDCEHRASESIGVEDLLQEIQADIHTVVPETAQTIKEIMQYVDANYIHGFMSNQQRREIREQSPNKIAVQGAQGDIINVTVTYKDHAAEITVADYDEIRQLPQYIPELDGRVVTVKVTGSSKVESYQTVTSGKYEGNRALRRGGRGSNERFLLFKSRR